MSWIILFLALLLALALQAWLPRRIAGRPTDRVRRVSLAAGVLAIGNALLLLVQIGDRASARLVSLHLLIVLGAAAAIIFVADLILARFRPRRSPGWLFGGIALFLLLFLVLPWGYLAFRNPDPSIASLDTLIYAGLVCAASVEWWAHLSPRR